MVCSFHKIMYSIAFALNHNLDPPIYQPIHRSTPHQRIVKNLRPFVEIMIADNDRRMKLVTIADDFIQVSLLFLTGIFDPYGQFSPYVGETIIDQACVWKARPPTSA